MRESDVTIGIEDSRNLSDDPPEPTALSAVEAERAQQHYGMATLEEELLHSATEIDEESEDDAAAVSEEEEPVFHPNAWHGELPPALLDLVDARLGLWNHLLHLKERRQELRKYADEETLIELHRQDREANSVPPKKLLLAELHRLCEGLGIPIASGDPQRILSVEPDGFGNMDAEDLDHLAREIGVAQAKLLLARPRLDSRILAVTAEIVGQEGLLQTCRKYSVAAEALLGHTYFALGVQQRMQECVEQEESYQAQIEANAEEERGKRQRMVSRILTGRHARDSIAPLDPEILRTKSAARCELGALETELVELFWGLYEEVAWLFVSAPLGEQDRLILRAFLRYGLVSVHPGLIEHDTADFIVEDCRTDVLRLSNTSDATHVLYPDEYLFAVYNLRTTTSTDEDLELNRRGAPEWKADRVWRRCVTVEQRYGIFRDKLALLQEQLGQTRAQAALAERNLEAKQSRRKSRTPGKQEVEHRALRARVMRQQRVVEHFERRILADLREQQRVTEQKMEDAWQLLTPEMIIRREARFIRRSSRLCARLKEYFAPFVLRDRFKPMQTCHHSRPVVRQAIAQHEQADGSIFHLTVIPAEEAENRVTVRLSPVFLIVPVCGQMGLSANPRAFNDNGRIILPLLSCRPDKLRSMLIDSLADFRWDCSLEEAGMDWITGDALCAAYSAVRWGYRNRSLEDQKKAGFEKKKRDRQNWRLHYRLFITSVGEQGRRLYSKCGDVYDVVLKYIGLPAHMEPLGNNKRRKRKRTSRPRS